MRLSVPWGKDYIDREGTIYPFLNTVNSNTRQPRLTAPARVDTHWTSFSFCSSMLTFVSRLRIRALNLGFGGMRRSDRQNNYHVRILFKQAKRKHGACVYIIDVKKLCSAKSFRVMLSSRPSSLRFYQYILTFPRPYLCKAFRVSAT